MTLNLLPRPLGVLHGHNVMLKQDLLSHMLKQDLLVQLSLHPVRRCWQLPEKR